MTLLDALDDPGLFGASFGGEQWRSWRVFLKATFGLPMNEAEAALYRECTGRPTAPTVPAAEMWCVAGRRGGKSRVSALLAVWMAAFKDYSRVLAAGEVGTLPIVAADRRQARVTMGYVTGLLDGVPLLRTQVTHRTAESLTLGRVRIEIHTASWRALRGYTVVGAVLDEVCFWRSDDSANPDSEIVAALRPAMATVPDALLVAISSPHSRRGVMWETHRRHHGPQGDPRILTWVAPTRRMNPNVSQQLIDDALALDEAAARAEYLAEWRSDLEAFVAREVLDAVTVPGRLSVPPLGSVAYHAFVDPSGGSQDAMTLAIAHLEQRGDVAVAVLDRVVERRPPFSPENVVEEFAAVLAEYGIRSVTGDRYGGEWPRERFRVHGVDYEPSERTKSELYGELLPLLNGERCELLDNARLHAQLLGLERKTSRAGRSTVDHGPHGADDLSNSAAGALVLAAAEGMVTTGITASNLAEQPYRSSFAADHAREFPGDRDTLRGGPM